MTKATKSCIKEGILFCAILVFILSCVGGFVYFITPTEYPSPAYKYKQGEIVKFIVNGQKGQIISAYYYTTIGLPLYDIRTSQKSSQIELNGSLFYGASGGSATPMQLSTIKDVHEYEIEKI